MGMAALSGVVRDFSPPSADAEGGDAGGDAGEGGHEMSFGFDDPSSEGASGEDQ
jgi:hypothetical protein